MAFPCVARESVHLSDGKPTALDRSILIPDSREILWRPPDGHRRNLSMVTTRRAILSSSLLGALALAAPFEARAMTWPQRPVKFIVPFGPGAGADIGARVFAEKLQARWGQPVIVENRPGGDSLVAITAFLNANDDHTFLFAPAGNFTVHPFVYSKLSYDPKDLVPIARASNTI